MNKDIIVIGNFGYHNNILNGQTMRTRTVYNSIVKYLPVRGTKISYFDTSKKVSFLNILYRYTKLFLKNLQYDIFILMPAQKAVKYLVPLYYLYSLICNKKIHYVAIGGWLGEFLKVKKRYISFFQSFDYVYVQTKELENNLKKIGLENVVHFPNYRIYNNKEVEIKEIDKEVKIVFFARVMREKGIEIAVNSIKKVNQYLNTPINLDIYGPVEKRYQDEFNNLLNDNKNIHYHGTIEPDLVVDVLNRYDLLLFPTFYIGEGFPGTILDAFTAGLPIIASDWKYNASLVENNKTGVILENNNEETLAKELINLLEDTKLINSMKYNCLKESKKFHESKIAPILVDRIMNSKGEYR